jgi:hypothetical protein
MMKGWGLYGVVHLADETHLATTLVPTVNVQLLTATKEPLRSAFQSLEDRWLAFLGSLQ